MVLAYRDPTLASAPKLATQWQATRPLRLAATTSAIPMRTSKQENRVSADLKRHLIAILPRLRRFARTLTKSASDSDDLVQDACLKALGSADLWDPSQPLDRWMFRMMRNMWISELRKRKVRLGEGHVLADESDVLVSHETGETSLAATQLRASVHGLPDDLSAVLLLVSIEGYSYAETAALLEIPVGTVMSRVHRARKTLAQQLKAPSQVPS